MERLKAVSSWESQGLVQGKGGFSPQGFTMKLPGRLCPGFCFLLPPPKGRSSLGKGKSALFARPGESKERTRVFLVFAEPGSQLDNRVAGVLHHPSGFAFWGISLARPAWSCDELGLPAELSVAAASTHHLCKPSEHTSGYLHGEAGGSHSFCRAGGAAWGSPEVATQPVLPALAAAAAQV